MKRIIFTMATVCIASLMFAGLAVASKTMAAEGQMGDAAMGEASHQMGEAAMGSASHEMAAQPLGMDQIREMQKLLNDKGYEVGAADGTIGPSTTVAIQNFQSDNNLTSTGTPDAETLRLLSPDSKTQEFFGLAPEYGEPKEKMGY